MPAKDVPYAVFINAMNRATQIIVNSKVLLKLLPQFICPTDTDTAKPNPLLLTSGYSTRPVSLHEINQVPYLLPDNRRRVGSLFRAAKVAQFDFFTGGALPLVIALLEMPFGGFTLFRR